MLPETSCCALDRSARATNVRLRSCLWLTSSDADGRVDKTHFSVKYDMKSFMEAEFARRNLFKQTAKESK